MASSGVFPGDPRSPRGLSFPIAHEPAAKLRARDLGERLRRAERERDAALDANRVKDAFLAELSHELRSPLQVMTAWLALLRAGTLDPAMREHALDVIERNLMAQTVLVDDLLDVARIAAGKLSVEPLPVDLATLVAHAVDERRLGASRRGVTLLGPASREPLIVLGDARLLSQVVANLLGNAVKFTPAGGTVRVGLEEGASGVTLEVQDSGEGIAPELLPHVFDRLRQGCAGGGRSRGGLGLGLTIAKHLIERLGGSISATSDGVGRGARFCVTLPRDRR